MNLIDTSSEEKILNKLKYIQRVYLIFLCLLGLWTLPILVSIVNGPPIPEDEIQSLIQFVLYITVYTGLTLRRSWAIPLVLVISSFAAFLSLINFVSPAADIKALYVKAVAGSFCMFFVYQVIFFSRKEVKALFNTKTKVLIG